MHLRGQAFQATIGAPNLPTTVAVDYAYLPPQKPGQTSNTAIKVYEFDLVVAPKSSAGNGQTHPGPIAPQLQHAKLAQYQPASRARRTRCSGVASPLQFFTGKKRKLVRRKGDLSNQVAGPPFLDLGRRGSIIRAPRLLKRRWHRTS